MTANDDSTDLSMAVDEEQQQRYRRRHHHPVEATTVGGPVRPQGANAVWQIRDQVSALAHILIEGG